MNVDAVLGNFFIVSLIKSALVAFVLLTALAYIQWVERTVLAHIQLARGSAPGGTARVASAAGRRDQAADEGRHAAVACQQVLLFFWRPSSP